MTHTIVKTSIVFSVICALLLFGAGFFYKDLGCDGGWYSYPGLSKSRNGSPDENLSTIASAETIEGVKALYGFRAYHSIRIAYTALWFKIVPANIYSLKIISLLELLALFATCYFLMAKFCDDKWIPLILLAILINDKTIVLNAATDFRPDNMVAAFTCLTFMFLLKKGRAFVILSAVSGCLLVLVHVTAVIPFICLMLFFGLRNGFSGDFTLKENYKYAVVGILAVIVFMNRDAVFNFLYSPGGHALPISVIAEDKVVEAWNKGFFFIWAKEFSRWTTYFFTTNVAQLLVLLTGVVLILKRPFSQMKNDPVGMALILSTVSGFVLLAVLDPHRADMHAIPLIPFFFMMTAHGIQSNRLQGTKFIYVLLCLLWIANLSSLALAAKITLAGKRSGYSIGEVRTFFDRIFQDGNRRYLVVGPTEIWPFIPADRQVLIIDETRSGKDFKILDPVVDAVDYIVINKDYSSYQWVQQFSSHFPDLDLTEIDQIGGSSHFLKVFGLKNKGI